MNLKNGTTLFKELVRAPNLATYLAENDIRMQGRGVCADHPDEPVHFYIKFRGDGTYEGVCELCVRTSRALSHVGRAGGRKGGRSLSPRKLEQLRAASESASVKARERREARNETGKTGDQS